MQYYLSLPDNWNAKKTWPIVVTIDGSGQNWLANATTFASARKEAPFIIVTPLVLTNIGRPTPEKYHYSKVVWDEVQNDFEARFRFDQQGILEVVQEVAKQYSGQKKFFLTGFSAGGHTAWSFIFAHPEKLAGAALACANYLGRGVNEASTAPERVKLPVKGFQGSEDASKAAFEKQWSEARGWAQSTGYRNLSYEIVPGTPHSPMAQQVLTYFESLLTRTAR